MAMGGGVPADEDDGLFGGLRVRGRRIGGRGFAGFHRPHLDRGPGEMR